MLAPGQFDLQPVAVRALALAVGGFLSCSSAAARAAEPSYQRPDVEAPPPPQLPPASEGGDQTSAETPVPEGPAPRPKPNGMMIAGYVTAGLAVAALGPLIAGVVIATDATDDFPGDRTQLEQDDENVRRVTGNRLAAAGGIAAGTLGITAIVLVAAGKQRRDASGDDAHVRVAPAVGRDGAGFTLVGRF